MDTMVMEISKLDAPLGAEVLGLDLRGKLDGQTISTLLEAWYEHQVLVFRGQDLTPQQMVTFTEQLGEPGRPRMPSQAVHDLVDGLPREVMIVSNIRIDGKPMGLPHDGEMWFHHDMSYTPEPHKATLLHALELPSKGGNTKFANMYLGYQISIILSTKISI